MVLCDRALIVINGFGIFCIFSALQRISLNISCGYWSLNSLLIDKAALKRVRFRCESFRRGRRGRRVRARVSIAAGILLAAMSSTVQAEEPIFNLDIPAMNAAEALNRLAEQTGAIMLFPYNLAHERKANAVHGQYTLLDGLEVLLKDTGLSGGLSHKRVVNISLEDVHQRIEETEPEEEKMKLTKMSGIAAFFSAMFVAPVGSAQDVSSGTTPIDEIVVTAQKRAQRIQDVAMSISVIDSSTIDRRNLVEMGDYLSTVPGVTMQDRGAGENSVVIRGIGVDPQKETEAVSVYFGQTPVSGLGFLYAGTIDLKMIDIDRVEVLRGPQGTLYGAGSMGGSVRVIPKAPDLNGFSGKLSAQFSETAEAGGTNNLLQGMVNIPLVDNVLAVRGVAYQVDDTGYVENIGATYVGTHPVIDKAAAYGTPEQLVDSDDIGRSETTGARVAVLWEPIDALAITAGYTWQETEQFGLNEVDLALPGKFEQVALLPGPLTTLPLDGTQSRADGTEIDTGIATLLAEIDVGVGQIVSSSSWLETEGVWSVDLTGLGFTVAPYNLMGSKSDETFVQELNFISDFQGSVQVTLGYYYDDRDLQFTGAEGFSGDPDTGADAIAEMGLSGYPLPPDAPPGFEWETIYHQGITTTATTEQAFFGELTWQMTDTLAATVGARFFDIEQDYLLRGRSFWWSAYEVIERTRLGQEADGDNYKFDITWTPNDQTTFYGLVSEGFRLGNSNDLVPRCDEDGNGFYDLPDGESIEYKEFVDPDSLQNFELGYKGTFNNGRANLHASIYHIDWEGLPVSRRLEYCLAFVTVNAGKSTSSGIELESQFQLSDTLTAYVSASYNEAKLDGDSTLGSDGDDLPGSADYNFGAGAEYAFNFIGHDSFFRFDYAYVGEYDSYISQPEDIPSSGDYHLLNAKAGVNFNRVDLEIFVQNLTNDDSITWTETAWGAGTLRAYRLRPRTFGITMNYSF